MYYVEAIAKCSPGAFCSGLPSDDNFLTSTNRKEKMSRKRRQIQSRANQLDQCPGAGIVRVSRQKNAIL